jgi:hypothetical protein
MTDCHDPMVPEDADLRGMPWMRLDVVRLLDSDLYALSSGDEFKAAVSLWAKSWHQIPAGSLPADERVLAHLSGAGSRWKKLRGMALKGWIKCRDGRLYHPVIAEHVQHAWSERQAHIAKRARENDRLASWRQSKREKGELSKTGAKVSRGTETQKETLNETTVKRVSHALRNGSETQMKRLREGEGEYSVAIATGGAPPSGPLGGVAVDPIKSLFDRGVAVLGGQPTARTLLGKLRREYGDAAVLSAIAAAEAEAPSEPVSWLIAACKSASSTPAVPASRRTPSLATVSEREMAVAAEMERREAANAH